MKNILALTLLIGSLTVGAGQDVEQLLRINGTMLNVSVIGKGSPIIVIHGGPGLNYTYFLPQLKALAATHQLIFYDQRACGKSSGDLDSTQMTLDWFVKDVESIRKELGLGKVSILAHSWGGILGMLYAGTYPKNIKSLLLINTVSPKFGEFDETTNKVIRNRYSKEDSTLQAQILKSDAFRNGDLKTYSTLFKISFKYSFYRTSYVDSMNLILPVDFVQKRKKLFYMTKELSAYDFYPLLSNIKCPTLIVHGSYDAIPIDLSKKIQNSIKGSELKVIDEAGHFPFIEKRMEFTSIITSFLKNNP